MTLDFDDLLAHETEAEAIARAKIRFHHWVRNAHPGETRDYHTGHLGLDRAHSPLLHALAGAARAAADAGLVTLCQRPVTEKHQIVSNPIREPIDVNRRYIYIAQRTARRWFPYTF